MDSLDLKHSKSVLIALSKTDTAKKSDLFTIIKSHQVLDNLLEALQKDDYLTIQESKVGPRRYFISLTSKGRLVAEQLKKAEEIAESTNEVKDRGTPSTIEISEEAAARVKELRLLYHVNVMDDHVTIEEVLRTGAPPRIFNVYVKRNGHGDFRLWCEEDNSFSCVHAEVAWTYPQVQHMILHYKGKTKICPVCGYENPEEAKFCMKCGAKLE